MNMQKTKLKMKASVLAALVIFGTVPAPLGAFAAVHTGKGAGGAGYGVSEAAQAPSENIPKTEERKELPSENGPAAAPSGSTVCPYPSTSSDTGTGALEMTDSAGNTYYVFNGKKYIVEEDWGSHYLTGFCPGSDGSRMTRSGNDARSNYTVSSTYANLGRVMLIKAERGGSETSDIKRYDGVYMCEDTGGEAVEYGRHTTMDTPVVDIFFDTEHEADFVSEKGWITARIYFLKEVE